MPENAVISFIFNAPAARFRQAYVYGHAVDHYGKDYQNEMDMYVNASRLNWKFDVVDLAS